MLSNVLSPLGGAQLLIWESDQVTGAFLSDPI